MLILSKAEVENAASLDEILEAIEESLAIYGQGNFYMPDRIHVDYQGKTLLYMPCVVDDRLMGTKYLTMAPGNRKRGLPSLDGMMILNDFETGFPLCLMSGTALTGMRTGALGGVGVRHTTPEDLSTAGLIGTGVQGLNQLRYAAHVRKLRRICLYNASLEKMQAFAGQLEKVIPAGIEIVYCHDAAELLAKSELVITTTTSEKPVLPDDEKLLRGKHYIAIGSYKPAMRELPDALFKVVDHVFYDVDYAKEESGDLSQPLASGLLPAGRLARLGDYVRDCKDKDAVKRSTTVVKSVGMGVFDVVAGDLIYRKAKQNGLGLEVDF